MIGLIIAFAVALVLSISLTPVLIHYLIRHQYGQFIRQDGPTDQVRALSSMGSPRGFTDRSRRLRGNRPAALHGRGTGDLLDAVMAVLPTESAVASALPEGGPRRVALIGRGLELNLS